MQFFSHPQNIFEFRDIKGFQNNLVLAAHFQLEFQSGAAFRPAI